MKELAKRFIDKECLLYLIGSQQLECVVMEVSEDGAILVREKGGEISAINLDCVMRLREYPRGKNGKKKSVVLD